MSITKPATGEPAFEGYAGSYLKRFRDVWNVRETILIVCDGSIAPRERIWDFTLTEVIASIEASHWFKFVVATRNGEFKEIRVPLPISPQGNALASGPVPPVADPDYEGFRFDRPEVLARLNDFGQIWLMGALGSGESNNPLSDAELAILVAWMNRGGGVLAAGDHEEMGAAIASRIPRVNSMRRWLDADEVPDQYDSDRLETTRPGTIAEALGAQVSDQAERDLVAQQIEWVPEYVGPAHSTPHPLLCHPRLGPIDVLPDHMHEGRCYDPQSADWQQRFTASQYSFGSVAGDVYPSAVAGGSRPLPRVVAWGNTLAAPPLKFYGGPQEARRFRLILAYDGRPAGVGRVVTDSTWHHWFDYNLEGFAGNREHEFSRKIYRYWLNVALWLSRSARITGLVLSEIKDNEFKFFGRQMVDLKAPSYQVGRATIAWLGASLSPASCAVLPTSWRPSFLPAPCRLRTMACARPASRRSKSCRR